MTRRRAPLPHPDIGASLDRERTLRRSLAEADAVVAAYREQLAEVEALLLRVWLAADAATRAGVLAEVGEALRYAGRIDPAGEVVHPVGRVLEEGAGA